MEITSIPLVGNTIIKDFNVDSTQYFTSYTKGQIFTNHEFYQIENPITNKNTLFSQHRPGIITFGTFAPVAFTLYHQFREWFGYNNGTGTLVLTGTDNPTGRTKIYVAGDTYNFVYASGSTAITHMSESRNSSGTDSILLVRESGGYAAAVDYYIYPRGGAMTAITVPSGSKGAMVTIKGWTFVANIDGKIYNSPLNNPQGSYTDFISADMFPDGLVDIVAYKDHLIAFGQQSYEVFEVVNNTTGSPLRYLPQYHKKIGLSSLVGTYRPYDHGQDTVFFKGSGHQVPENALYMFKGDAFVVEEITTPTIRPLFTSTPRFMKIGTKNYITSPVRLASTEHSVLVYDLDLKLWSVWTVSTSTFTSFEWRSFGSNSGQSYVIGQGNGDSQAVIIYPEQHATHGYRDNVSTAVTREIITEKIDFGSNKLKIINYIKLLGNQESSTAAVSISWSDDDGANYSTAVTVDMSTLDPVVWGCGATRRRIFKISDTLNAAARYSSIEIGYTLCDH